MGNEKEVIILNKPFLGGWLNGEGKIGHEIIDFFLADNGKYYVYNNPWGACPKTIWVGIRDNENEYGLKKTKDEEYIAKYMVLTGGAHAMGDGENGEDESTNKKGKSKTFNILYVIELKEKIHRKNTGKNLETNQNAIKEIITTKKSSITAFRCMIFINRMTPCISPLRQKGFTKRLTYFLSPHRNITSKETRAT